MDKRWIFQPIPEEDAIASLAGAINVDNSIASLLVQKGVTNFEQAKNYFRPSLDDLHSPFSMKNMDKAVRRLLQAIENHENILVYGDYDVDGVTSVSLVYGFLRQYYDKLQFYIPDRYKEGYGVSTQGINWAIDSKISLIITLDCGIKAIECIGQAKEAGIDVIVCDHHEPGEVLPDAYAILDPKQIDCPYPYKELSGCGVGFKLLQAFITYKNLPQEALYKHLDLVAISIAADLVPLTGENRILAYHGLKKLNQNPSPGIRAIIQVAGLSGRLEISQLVFALGPRLNAAGRVDHGSLAVRLLLAQDLATATQIAHQVEQKNGFRRQLDNTITTEAIQLIENRPIGVEAKTTVLFKEDWHKGVIGIVASRCIERYYRPTVILTASGNKATGSARSVAGYNIYEAITACADLLDQYGGHAYAAGLTLPLENIVPFQDRFEEVVASTISQEQLVPVQKIDLILPLDKINTKFYNILNQMAPFGNGNMKPVFATGPVIANRFSIVKEHHLKLSVQQPDSGPVLEAIGFGLAKYEPLVRDRKPFRIAYTLEKNNYQGEVNLQLNIKELQPI